MVLRRWRDGAPPLLYWDGCPNQPTQAPEETLDPADWPALRALGHRMLDDMVTYLQTRREQPVWQPVPDEIRAQFHEPLPRQGEPAEAVYDDFCRTVLPYMMGNTHPRFWGWVMGPGTPVLAVWLIRPRKLGTEP